MRRKFGLFFFVFQVNGTYRQQKHTVKRSCYIFTRMENEVASSITLSCDKTRSGSRHGVAVFPSVRDALSDGVMPSDVCESRVN